MALTGSRGYKLIAEVLHDTYRKAQLYPMTHGWEWTVEQLTRDLADLFQKEHPHGFDRQRFYQNVGLIPMKESNHAIRER